MTTVARHIPFLGKSRVGIPTAIPAKNASHEKKSWAYNTGRGNDSSFMQRVVPCRQGRLLVADKPGTC